MNALTQSLMSVRGKLILCCITVQIIAVCSVIFYSNNLLQALLLKETTTQLEKAARLVEIGTATPLLQRDYVTVQQILDSARGDPAIDYLLLRDHKGKLVASTGWDVKKPLPPKDTGPIDLYREDTTIHVSSPMFVEGQTIGDLYVGLSTVTIRETSAEYLAKSIKIVATALLISIFLMIMAVSKITKKLGQLALAARQFTGGNFDARVAINSKDEIGDLAIVFNQMASTLKERIHNIEENGLVQLALKNEAIEEQARFLALLESMPIGIAFVNLSGNVAYANSEFCRIWALPKSPVGRPAAELTIILKTKVSPADEMVVQHLLDGAQTELGSPEVELRTSDARIFSQRTQHVLKETNVIGQLWFHSDITSERSIQLRAYQALHDSLTHLVNRRGLYEALQAALTRSGEGTDGLSLLFIDLDDFKYANDVGGHRLGDDILVAVARTLSEHCTAGQIVGRLGGDEFAILCPHTTSEQALLLAETLIGEVRRLSFVCGAQTLKVGCSIGVACFPTHATTEDELFVCADSAMYSAKRSGKNRCVIYQHEFEKSAPLSEQTDWTVRIERLLRSKQLRLFYQSVHEATQGHVTHFEALLRIPDGENPGTFLGPADFIIQAERSGQILEIDRWVLQTVVETLSNTDELIKIAANVSARTMAQSSFADFVVHLLTSHSVNPARLLIELTETCFLDNKILAAQVIQQLREIGCDTHLDDFGGGFSSFAQLRDLQTSTIKIDGQFIREMHTKVESRIFVESIIKIAHSLDKKVIAEHVETERDFAVLQDLSVDMVQGYYFSRPGPLLDMQSHVFLDSVSLAI